MLNVQLEESVVRMQQEKDEGKCYLPVEHLWSIFTLTCSKLIEWTHNVYIFALCCIMRIVLIQVDKSI